MRYINIRRLVISHLFYFAGINRIQLLGRVGRTPAQFGMEPRTTVAFSLATNRAVKVTKEDGTGREAYSCISVVLLYL